MIDPPRRLDALTSLRWFAALGVFLVHSSLLIFVIARWYFRSTEVGSSAGVSFFFMLSGLVLSWAHSDDRGRRPFWQNRVARIWPLHLVTLIAALGLPWLIAGFGPVVSRVPPVAFLVQSWIPSQPWFFAPNIVSWSLSCEIFFYAVFPWVGAWIATVRRPIAFFFGLLAVIWALPLATFTLDHEHTMWAVYIFPVARLPEFVLGILLCRMVREGRVRWTNTWIPAAVVIAAVLAGRWIPNRFALVAWTVIPLAWLLGAAANRAARGQRSILTVRPLLWLGEISFAFYLVHALVLRWLPPSVGWLQHGFFRRPKPLFVVLFLASVVCAWLVHALIEVPMERRLRATRPHAATGDTAASLR